MPIIFNLHQLALFHMPNSAYYPTLAGKPSAVFYPEVYYGMTYAGLEFLTMVMAIKHIGADFSFKFSWLHSPKTAS
ncbi:hypothetical protein PF005_g3173 [Phytophthora fragariae]|uniref:Uncharacterized protein n=1 Tax=Phytophthora fragariae TaxID=53985 RepID=A0A6A3ZAP7_9STRA|nr:hypothetical protein PF007_g3091 [Phytophthora fragariae]KAE9153290.1 hypothetical protein PF006_g2558 [Phytophthora fragariae]KAE9231198.1 hypothetical protein PF005_g3173 [Phytophthora fragariae]